MLQIRWVELINNVIELNLLRNVGVRAFSNLNELLNFPFKLGPFKKILAWAWHDLACLYFELKLDELCNSTFLWAILEGQILIFCHTKLYFRMNSEEERELIEVENRREPIEIWDEKVGRIIASNMHLMYLYEIW